MTQALVIRSAAEADIERAFHWYEEQSPGLGAEFVRSIDAALAAIQRHPELFPDVHQGIRRALLRRFPYALFYVVEPQRIQVLACMHHRQHPRRWQSRG